MIDSSDVLVAIGEWDTVNGEILSSAERVRVTEEATALLQSGKFTTSRLLRWFARHTAQTPRANASYVKGLARQLRAIGPRTREQLDDLAMAFKAEVERSARRVFEITRFQHEEVARTLLLFYLRPRGYPEARLGAGHVDIVVPDLRAIFETKIVRSKADIDTGLSQLADYLNAERTPRVTPRGFLFLIARDRVPIYASSYGEIEMIRGWKIGVTWLIIPTEAPSKKGMKSQAKPRVTRSRRRARPAA